MKPYLLMVLFFIAAASDAECQKMDTTLRLSVQVGTGLTHYYNNLIIHHNTVRNNFQGSSMRLMWEPQHRLSIGLETGYYKLYEAKLEDSHGSTAHLSVIPVMANIRMRITKNFSVTGGTGIVVMKSEVYSPGNDSKSSVFSYSNVQLSGLYLYHLTEQFAVGGELKFMWIDKTNDFIYSLQGVVSYRF